MNKVFSISLLIGLSFLCTFAQNSWQGITPLKSTRVDVEKKFGKPIGNGRYERKNYRVTFFYIDQTCENTENCRCLAPQGTVHFIVFKPYYLKLKDLKLDLSKYEKTVSSRDANIITYSDEEQGVYYETAKDDGKVWSITYAWSEADCREILNKGKNVE